MKNRMNVKRPRREDSLNKASVVNMLTSEVIPIKKEKEGSSTGTFLNHKILPKGIDHGTELQQEDVISFGYRNKIFLSYQFILHSLPAKKHRLSYEYEILEARKEVEKYKKTVLEHQGEIADLKCELKKLRNTAQSKLAEMLSLVKNVMGITHAQSLKAREIIKQMSSKIAVLTAGDNSNKHILSEETKNQIYAQLKYDFQCSICLELVCKATTISCNHTFCHVCIRTWKNNSNSKCPVCRAPFRRDNNCRALDNFITTFCDFMGGAIKEQRQLMLKQKSIVVPVTHNRRRTRMADLRDFTLDDDDYNFGLGVIRRLNPDN